jgi:hypothetical protein
VSKIFFEKAIPAFSCRFFNKGVVNNDLLVFFFQSLSLVTVSDRVYLYRRGGITSIERLIENARVVGKI